MAFQAERPRVRREHPPLLVSYPFAAADVCVYVHPVSAGVRYLERDLVFDASRCLSAILGDPVLRVAYEFDYRRGRVDIVGLFASGEIVALEAKLKRWRDALWQAYRNTTFARYSYVVLPLGTARNAMKHRSDFERFGVGVVAVEHGEASVLLESGLHEQVQPWLAQAVVDFVMAEEAR